MIPRELLKQIKNIEIRTNHLVTEVFSGEYESVFKGRGIEFEEVREYQMGDDIRTIDWNVTARMNHPYVKEFKEERELTIFILVDVSSSQYFGTAEKFKNDVAAEIAALIACTAIRNNDRVGLIIFTEKIEKYIPPKKGRGHVFRVITEILQHNPENERTKIKNALSYLQKIYRKRAVVFLISDFIDSDYEDELRVVSKRHDLIPIIIRDKREFFLPRLGLVEFKDSESGERILVDTSRGEIQNDFVKIAEGEMERRLNIFKRLKLDRIEIQTGVPCVDALVRFFRSREKRFR